MLFVLPEHLPSDADYIGTEYDDGTPSDGLCDALKAALDDPMASVYAVNGQYGSISYFVM